MSDREQLLAMGFQDAQVTKAMRATNNAGLTQACVPFLPALCPFTTSSPHLRL